MADHVTDELNTDRLMEEIEKVNSLYENLYTEDSWLQWKKQ